VLTFVVGLIAILASLSLASYLGFPMPSWLRGLADAAAGLQAEGDRWLLAIGVAASALYAFVAARSQMDLNERNASRFFTTSDNLEYLEENELGAALDGAAAGSETEVRELPPAQAGSF